MPLKGSLRDFSLPDLFQLIHFGKKNGTLNIANGDAKGYVCFRNGNVFFATHNWKRPPLGQRLTESGMVTEEQIDEALDLQKTTRKGQRLGNILVELGYLSRESLEVFVEEQIRDAVFHLLRWTEGDFDFDPNQIFPEEDIGLSMTTEDLIMEGSRRLDEWYQIEKKVPSLDAVFRMTKVPGKDASDINLTSEEWLVLYHVDGESTVRDIIEKSGQSALVTCKALYGLVTAGLVVLAGADAEVASPPGALEDEIERLEEGEPVQKVSATAVEAPPAAESEALEAAEEALEEAGQAVAEAEMEAVAAEADEVAEAEAEAAPRKKRKTPAGKKKPVEEITVGDAEEEVTVEEVSGEDLDLDESGRRRKKSRRKGRRTFGAAGAKEAAQPEAEEEPAVEAPAEETAAEEKKEPLIIHDEVEAPEVSVKEAEPAPGQSLVDYYKSLALKEASDNDRLLAFQETEDKKKVELAQEYDEEFVESVAHAAAAEEEAEFEEPDDIPLEWAGHLTRLRGGSKRSAHKSNLGHVDAEAEHELEVAPDEPELAAETVEEPMMAEAEQTDVGVGVTAVEPDVAHEVEPAAEDLEVVAYEEAEAPAAEEIVLEIAAEVPHEPQIVAPESLDEVPPAAANYVTMEQEMEAQALSAEEPVYETEAREDELTFIGEEEMVPAEATAEAEEVPAEDIPLIDESVREGRIPTEEEIEQLLQAPPMERDLTREELLAFDQPTYPVGESRDVPGEQEVTLEAEPVTAPAKVETESVLGTVLQFKGSAEAAPEVELEDGAPVVEMGETEEIVTAEDLGLEVELEIEAVPEEIEAAAEEIEAVDEPEIAPLAEQAETILDELEAEVLQLEDASASRDEGVPPLAIEVPMETEAEAEEAQVIPLDARRQPSLADEATEEQAEVEAEEPTAVEEDEVALAEAEELESEAVVELEEEPVELEAAPAVAEAIDEIAAIEEQLLEEAGELEEPAEVEAALEQIEESVEPVLEELEAEAEQAMEPGEIVLSEVAEVGLEEEIVFGETIEAEPEAAELLESESMVLESEPVTFADETVGIGSATFETEPVLDGAEPVTLTAEGAVEPAIEVAVEPAVASASPFDMAAEAEDTYFDEMDALREITGGAVAPKQKAGQAAAPEAASEPEPVYEDDFVTSSSSPAVEMVLEEEEEEVGFDLDDEGLGLKVRGKRGAGTSLVDLETFELEQELLELAGGVKETRRRITQSDRDATEGKGKKEKKGRGKGSKEVDKGSVKKIIDDLKKM